MSKNKQQKIDRAKETQLSKSVDEAQLAQEQEARVVLQPEEKEQGRIDKAAEAATLVARRHALLSRARSAILGRASQILRPLDSSDKDALEVLLEMLLRGRQEGYSQEEEEAMEALWADWREGRKNTP